MKKIAVDEEIYNILTKSRRPEQFGLTKEEYVRNAILMYDQVNQIILTRDLVETEEEHQYLLRTGFGEVRRMLESKKIPFRYEPVEGSLTQAYFYVHLSEKDWKYVLENAHLYGFSMHYPWNIHEDVSTQKSMEVQSILLYTNMWSNPED